MLFEHILDNYCLIFKGDENGEEWGEKDGKASFRYRNLDGIFFLEAGLICVSWKARKIIGFIKKIRLNFFNFRHFIMVWLLFIFYYWDDLASSTI